MLATLTLFLGLPLALATEPQSCAPLVPVTFDNTTIPQVSPASILSSPVTISIPYGYGRRLWQLSVHLMLVFLKKKIQNSCTGAQGRGEALQLCTHNLTSRCFWGSLSPSPCKPGWAAPS